MMWRWFMIGAVLFGFLQQIQTVNAQRTKCFDKTGYCVSDPILAYWEKNGGLAVFGYPISELQSETVEGAWTGPVQWFERDRLEDHGGDGVLAGRLGALVLENQGRPWVQGAESASVGCQLFPVTGYSVCEPFLSYWQKNGGLARFGYPISGRIVESNEGWSGPVQYFERRRMEWHRENAGTAYEVLLGRLGAVSYQATATNCQQLPASMRGIVQAVPFSLGCATAVEKLTITYQRFAQGIAMHVPSLNEVLYMGKTAMKRIVDTWQQSDLDVYLDGFIQITKNIGKAIMQTWGMREALGDAISAATTAPATVVRFSSGAVAVQIEGEDTIYVFGSSAEQFITLEAGP